jgi:hypothetical protein
VEYEYNLTQGVIEKSRLAQQAYEEGHKICWKRAKVLQIGTNTTYTKYKESSRMSLVDHLISQPSSNVSLIRTHYRSRSQETRTLAGVDYV